MRIARGLFRLWLFLSIAWIGAVGIVTWLGKPPFDPSKPFEVVPSNAASGVDLPDAPWITKPPFDPNKPFDPDKYLAEKAAPAQSSSDMKSEKRVLSDAEFHALKPQFDPSEFAAFKRREDIKTTAEVALIPPVLLLLIGLALGWVIRGFRN